MIWESEAAAAVRTEAEAMGYSRSDFEWAFRGYDPVDNIAAIDRSSAFHVSENDPFVPPARTARLIEAVRGLRPEIRIQKSADGHLRAMIASRSLQMSMARTK
jgi:fermentation-respiration switch protein FrsA (DUF1100 family)